MILVTLCCTVRLRGSTNPPQAYRGEFDEHLSWSLAPQKGVIKFMAIVAMNFVTLKLIRGGFVEHLSLT